MKTPVNTRIPVALLKAFGYDGDSHSTAGSQSFMNELEAFQYSILPGVSRTFALTIPQLPPSLRAPVTNAYLLCRIVDTVEDDNNLTLKDKTKFLQQFSAVLAGQESAEAFAKELAPLLSDTTIPAEHELIKNTRKVVDFTKTLPPGQQDALSRCVVTMSSGMHYFQQKVGLQGLDNIEELNSYCYYVAGVVGEMLTTLFCNYSPLIDKNREKLMRLAPAFGQGLQMTNILKDIWSDRKKGVCWLPQALFKSRGYELKHINDKDTDPNFIVGLKELIREDLRHLRDALRYTVLIPKQEKGIRQFCLWAIGLAILTLRNIHKHPTFKDGSEIKVSRRTVKWTMLISRLLGQSNLTLRVLSRSIPVFFS